MFVAPYSEGTSYAKYAVIHTHTNKGFKVLQSGINWLVSISHIIFVILIQIINKMFYYIQHIL